MLGFVLFLVIAIPVIALLVRSVRRTINLRDAEGRRLRTGMPARLALSVALLVALFVMMVTSVRVVPVGHALVIFNTVTKGFRLARQGVTFVWPVISQTEQYDLRRLEYTMSSTQGEGRKANLDDSLWSPTKEGLQVGIDLTVWHHLDPLRLIDIHQKMFALRDTMIIERDGDPLATIKRKRWSLLRNHYRVSLVDGTELDVSGKILDREFAVDYDGELLAQISRRWLHLRDTYGVDVVREDADPALLIAVAVCVIHLAEKERGGD